MHSTSRRAACLALLAGFLALAGQARAAGGSSWLAPNHDAAASNDNASERAITPATVRRLHRAWCFDLAGRFSNGSWSKAIATDRHLYDAVAQGNGSGLYRFSVVEIDARTGSLVRALPVPLAHLPQSSYATLGYDRNTLLVGTSLAVVAFSATTGHVLWTVSGGATAIAAAGPVVYTAKVCVFACEGAFFSQALQLTSGKVLWRRAMRAQSLTLIAGRLFEQVATGGDRGETQILDPATGVLAGALPWYGFWTGDRRTAYLYAWTTTAGSLQRDWVAEIGPTGKPRWKADVGRSLRTFGSLAGPVLAGATLYVPSDRFHPGVLALNTRSGRVLWGADLGADLDLVAAGDVLVALHRVTGELDLVNARSGGLLRRYRIPGYTLSGGEADVLIAGGQIYAVDDSSVIALRP